MAEVTATVSFSSDRISWRSIFDDPVTFSVNDTTYSAFASDLGLRPGEWYDYIRMNSNIIPLIFTRYKAKKDAEGDLEYFVYKCFDMVADTKLILYND